MTDEGKTLILGLGFVIMILLIVLGPFIGLGGEAFMDEDEDNDK